MAATVLLVMGLQAGLYVLERISLTFLERFMEETMEKVNQELFYIFALLERVHPNLLEHLEKLVAVIHSDNKCFYITHTRTHTLTRVQREYYLQIL